MRQIGALEHEPEAQRFSSYLSARAIDHSVDASLNPVTQVPSYVLWIHNEEQLAVATTYFEQFLKNPTSSEFDAPAPVVSEPSCDVPQKKQLFLTSFLIGLCGLIFFLSALQETPTTPEGGMTPIELELLYDAPSSFRGVYDWILLKMTGGDPSQALGPLFYKIRQGEVWRLFTPCILHAGLLHIAFNMLWLWVLGRQVELRIGWVRYLVLTLFLGIFGNTVQYLISGPFFLGYSGIVTGLAGFIWTREKIAPWEGYPLQHSVILFLSIFVLAMFALQLGSFLLLLFTSVQFTPNIANAAHVGGALFGILLGRLSYFEARGR